MPELQKSLLSLFHYSLNPGGVLFLGSAETIGEFTHLFAPLDGKTRLYRRLESGLRVEPVEFPPSFTPARTGVPLKALPPPANLQSEAEQLLLQRYAPAAVLSTTRATSSSSTGGRADTWSRRRAKPT
jgi:two-component system CheB/CheR fusion protein